MGPTQIFTENLCKTCNRAFINGLAFPVPAKCSRIPFRCSIVLGLSVVSDCYRYISLFVALFNIPMGLDDLLERIPPVYNRLQFAGLDKLIDKSEVLFTQVSHPADNAFTACH